MKFVPVPGDHVLFGIWDTRVQDYEKFVKAQVTIGPSRIFSKVPRIQP